MTATTGERHDVRAYLEALEAHLGDVPADERQDVLDDLAAHLAEVVAESDESLTERLGSPEAYAAELRASAGYDTSATAPRTRWAPLVQRAEAWGPAARAALLEARPGWWLFRGPMTVLAAAAFYQLDTFHGLRWPGPFGLLSVAILCAASIPLSITAGRWAAAGRGQLRTLLFNVAFAVFAVLAVGHWHDRGPHYVYVDEGASEPGFLRAGDGRGIFNIYPFAADGTPLEGVLLYDQDGVPLENLMPAETYDGSGQPVSQPAGPVDANGNPITNAYPRSLLIPGTGGPRADRRPAIGVPPTASTTTTTVAAPAAPAAPAAAS